MIGKADILAASTHKTDDAFLVDEWIGSTLCLKRLFEHGLLKSLVEGDQPRLIQHGSRKSKVQLPIRGATNAR